jgi:hypothetical protein
VHRTINIEAINIEERQLASAITTFLIGTATASAVWLLLTRRMQNRKVRRASPDGGTSGSGGTSSDGDAWSLGSWFGHSSSTGANHSTDSCGGWGSGDGGGTDCGGGDGGGGD